MSHECRQPGTVQRQHPEPTGAAEAQLREAARGNFRCCSRRTGVGGARLPHIFYAGMQRNEMRARVEVHETCPRERDEATTMAPEWEARAGGRCAHRWRYRGAEPVVRGRAQVRARKPQAMFVQMIEPAPGEFGWGCAEFIRPTASAS